MIRITGVDGSPRPIKTAYLLAGLALCLTTCSGCSHNASSGANVYNPALGNGRTAPPDVIAAQQRQAAAVAAAQAQGK